jgi:mannose-6-phosphate isomerase-like protein (cupin superfamily)
VPGISRETAAHHEDHGPVVDIHEDIGDYSINFLTFKVDIDGAPLLKGLPEDRCSCPHWGYVTNGQITFHFADHDETYAAGDAFYVPAGHTPEVVAGTEYVQFSPANELHKITEVMVRNTQELMRPA